MMQRWRTNSIERYIIFVTVNRIFWHYYLKCRVKEKSAQLFITNASNLSIDDDWTEQLELKFVLEKLNFKNDANVKYSFINF